MTKLRSTIKTSDPAYKTNFEHNQNLADLLAKRQQQVAYDRAQRVIERQKSRDKLLVRERIDAILDEGSPFLELSTLAAWDMHNSEAPSAGIVTGIGSIHGKECVIVANDPTVKGGTYFPETVKKHLRAQEIAEQ
ncbi:MAG: carboxyl transferase domain-containing protein, partial [Chloroflexota bacterium]